MGLNASRMAAAWSRTAPARPSDAIAVAVTCEPNLPISVADEVLENALGW